MFLSFCQYKHRGVWKDFLTWPTLTALAASTHLWWNNLIRNLKLSVLDYKKKLQPFSIASLWSVGFWAVSCAVVESRFWAPVQRQSPLVPSKLPPSPDSPWPALLWEYDWENGVWPRFGIFIPGHLASHQLDFVFNFGRSSAWTISEIHLKDTS